MIFSEAPLGAELAKVLKNNKADAQVVTIALLAKVHCLGSSCASSSTQTPSDPEPELRDSGLSALWLGGLSGPVGSRPLCLIGEGFSTVSVGAMRPMASAVGALLSLQRELRRHTQPTGDAEQPGDGAEINGGCWRMCIWFNLSQRDKPFILFSVVVIFYMCKLALFLWKNV